MESMDLDINNYNLKELLNLFKLHYNFTNEHLRQAKMIFLKTHPDRSHLSMKYFIFFKKAYEIVEKVYYFRTRRKSNCSYTNKYEVEVNKDNAKLLHSLNGKSIKEFNKWFNEMFIKVKIGDDEDDTGYGEWYKKMEKKENKKVPLRNFGIEFEKEKEKCKSIIVYDGIKEYGEGCGYNLSREKPREYSSDIFSKLRYEDLRKAHTETVVPVTREDYDRIPKFKNMDSYLKHRETQNISAPSLQQSHEYLDRINNQKNEVSARRAFSLIQQDIAVEEANKKWWSNLKLLRNK